ncbi:MAG: PEP-CTERM sorting domain-containing protein [Thiobacillus sp.]
MRKLFAGLILATTALPAFAIAVAPTSVPEPGALWLLGIGAVAGLIVKAKNRNSKKK